MTRKIIVVPCMVRTWLYFSGVSSVLSGTAELRAHQQRLDAAQHEEDERPCSRYMIPILL